MTGIVRVCIRKEVDIPFPDMTDFGDSILQSVMSDMVQSADRLWGDVEGVSWRWEFFAGAESPDAGYFRGCGKNEKPRLSAVLNDLRTIRRLHKLNPPILVISLFGWVQEVEQ